jgi:hypothetical protein
MASTTAPHHPALRLALGAICALCGSSFAGTVLWSEMGGGFGSSAQLAGVAGQESSAGQADRLNAGFLAHPLFLNTAPLAQDTSVKVTGDSLSVVVPADDVDGSVNSARVVVAPLHGAASFSGVLLAYSPVSGYVGTDSVGFQVVDDQGLASDTAWVRIQVAPIVTGLKAPSAVVRKVRNPDIRVDRWMASASLDASHGGLRISRDASDGTGLSISVLLASTADVQVQIFDNLGTLVTSAESVVDQRSFLDLPRTADGRRILAVHWDLRDGNARPVAAGVYLWKILVVTSDGQKLETVRKTGVKK